MATKIKAADLIGKVIIIGGTSAKYIVKSIEGDKLQCDFVNDGKTTPMSVPVSQVEKFIAGGKWTVADANEPSTISHQPSDIKTDADVAEVQDIVPVVTPKKSEGRGKTEEKPQTSDIKPQTSAKVEPIGKKSEGRGKMYDGRGKMEDVGDQSAIIHQPSNIPQPSAIKHQTSYVYATYQTSKGKTGAKITGVSETDAAYQQAAAIHASGSYERDKDGNKHYYLCFGPRYAEAAKKVCELLNAGKPIEDAIAVVNAATEERAVKKEEGRRKREEYKAQPSNISPQTSKGYSSKDVAEMLRKVLAGGDVPEDIKALMKAA